MFFCFFLLLLMFFFLFGKHQNFHLIIITHIFFFDFNDFFLLWELVCLNSVAMFLFRKPLQTLHDLCKHAKLFAKKFNW